MKQTVLEKKRRNHALLGSTIRVAVVFLAVLLLADRVMVQPMTPEKDTEQVSTPVSLNPEKLFANNVAKISVD